MKEVNIYIKESCDALCSKDGYYRALLTTEGKELQFSNSFSDTTNYRMIIQGAIDAIKKLNQPCVINLYTNTTFGMNCIRHSDGEWRVVPKKSVNLDLLLDLKDLIEAHGHELNNFYDKETIDAMFDSQNKSNDTKSVAVNLPIEVYEYLKASSTQQGIALNALIKEILVSWSKGGEY